MKMRLKFDFCDVFSVLHVSVVCAEQFVDQLTLHPPARQRPPRNRRPSTGLVNFVHHHLSPTVPSLVPYSTFMQSFNHSSEAAASPCEF